MRHPLKCLEYRGKPEGVTQGDAMLPIRHKKKTFMRRYRELGDTQRHQGRKSSNEAGLRGDAFRHPGDASTAPLGTAGAAEEEAV